MRRWLWNVALLILVCVGAGLVVGVGAALLYEYPLEWSLTLSLWLAVVLGLIVVPAILLGLGVLEAAAWFGTPSGWLRALAVALAIGLGAALAFEGEEDPALMAAILVPAAAAYAALIRLPRSRGARQPSSRLEV